MARHNEILTQFQEITPTFDFSNEAHINLVSAILNLMFFFKLEITSHLSEKTNIFKNGETYF